MLKSLLLAASLCGACHLLSAQTLPMPPEIRAVFDKGLHTASGKPGKNYWSNRGRYTLSVKVSPPDKLISGTEQITYFNNSPDELKHLNMKLIMNAHRTGGLEMPADPSAGIRVDDFKANGRTITWNNTTAGKTDQFIDLAEPLQPHDSVKLEITWHYPLKGSLMVREGYIDPTTFYLAYFYPRVAVYDDYKGWDLEPHTGLLEFYNDFNDYTLNVTVPQNYIVWATGDLRNASQVLQPGALKRLEASMSSDSTIHIATKQDIAAKTITAQNAVNTWSWTARNISDVAIAISDHYVWDAASVLVDDAKRRRASVQAAFVDTSADFHQSVQFTRNALSWYSHNIPGVPYPFSKMTAVQGFADMEYPMMVNDNHLADLKFAQMVADHEIGHTYFPFYMGINESRYAFMDEGWATTLEYLIAISENGGKYAADQYKNFRIADWASGQHTGETPIITPAPEVGEGAGNNFYNKPSLSCLALKDLLGDKLFKKALLNYMNNWNGKHPVPWDYFYSMNAGSGKNLDWFFYNWFFTPFYIDLKLTDVTRSGKDHVLAVRNIGGFAVPFDAIVTYTDGSTDTFHQTPAVWKKDQKDITVKLKTKKPVGSILLDGGIFMDADRTNNGWRNEQ